MCYVFPARTARHPAQMGGGNIFISYDWTWFSRAHVFACVSFLYFKIVWNGQKKNNNADSKGIVEKRAALSMFPPVFILQCIPWKTVFISSWFPPEYLTAVTLYDIETAQLTHDSESNWRVYKLLTVCTTDVTFKTAGLQCTVRRSRGSRSGIIVSHRGNAGVNYSSQAEIGGAVNPSYNRATFSICWWHYFFFLL